MPRSPSCLCGSCAKCKMRVRMRSYREQYPERAAELAAGSYQRHAAKRRAERKRYREENREKVLAADRDYTKNRRPKKERNRKKCSAQSKVWYAVRSGRLKVLPCEACGAAPVRHDGVRGVHAHHDDYDKPLEVRWLCYPCHGKEHRLYKEDE